MTPRDDNVSAATSNVRTSARRRFRISPSLSVAEVTFQGRGDRLGDGGEPVPV
jgi:hypothetical protein